MQIRGAFSDCLLVHSQEVTGRVCYGKVGAEVTPRIAENARVGYSQTASPLTAGCRGHLVM